MTLKEEWAKLKGEKDPAKIKSIQEKINSIELWCIEKKYGNFKEITDWTKPMKPKKTYRFEGQRDGGLNIPTRARVGGARCDVCKYNRHTWCALGVYKEGDEDYKICMANV